MKRSVVWGSVLGLAFLVLVGTWFNAKFEQVPSEKWTPPGKEARQNPHLALQRFLAAMGRPLTRADNAAFLDRLPAGGVLILDSQRRAHMTPDRVKRLLRWVEAGGYLIVAAEEPAIEDPVLAFFQVNCGCQPGDDKTPAAVKEKPPKPPASIAVTIPGAVRTLDVDFSYSGLTPAAIQPEWRAGAAGYADQILHFRHGAGNVTMLSRLSGMLGNQTIGHRDHAELLWTLIETYQPDRSRPLTLVTRLVTTKLGQWLLASAWTALISALALVALWLWAVVPRFGPPRPENAGGRRELGEHLAAIGRYVWRLGGLDHWLETAREAVRSRLALRHPAILALAPPAQAAALAELTQRPISLIAAALHQPARSPQSFTQAMRTLRSLERTL